MWEKLLVTLVVGILQWLAGRQDLKNLGRAQVYGDLAEKAIKALDVKAGLAARPDGGSNLRVHVGKDGHPVAITRVIPGTGSEPDRRDVYTVHKRDSGVPDSPKE